MSVQARKLVHDDIKPRNTRRSAADYLDAPNMPWRGPNFPASRVKALDTDGNGITTALFKLDPGAIVPLHEHTALEQAYAIEGSRSKIMKVQAVTGPVCVAAGRQSARSGGAATAHFCSVSFSGPPLRLW